MIQGKEVTHPHLSRELESSVSHILKEHSLRLDWKRFDHLCELDSGGNCVDHASEQSATCHLEGVRRA